MKKGGKGGAKTKTGLAFEGRVDIQKLLTRLPGYSVKEIEGQAGLGVFYNGKLEARCFRKHAFYKFLEENNINYIEHISKRLLPDDALLVVVRKTLFIVEVKFQEVDGSVDEKLQTCDFKRKQYMKLVSRLGLRVEYVYVLNDYFRDPRYKDVLEYIQSVHCNYMFNEIPLAWLGLPIPE
jgi:hypothetical protein